MMKSFSRSNEQTRNKKEKGENKIRSKTQSSMLNVDVDNIHKQRRLYPLFAYNTYIFIHTS